MYVKKCAKLFILLILAIAPFPAFGYEPANPVTQPSVPQFNESETAAILREIKAFGNVRVSARRAIAIAEKRGAGAGWATPLRVVWVCAPPRSSAVTSSCVTVLTTSGPVTNMYDVSRTMKMKSVMAGE